MSRRANPTIVGAFILGAIALVVIAVVVFGSGVLFRHRPRAVAFFRGNIQGLTVGAPVNLRGVRVGQVTEIRIDVDVSKRVAQIPVYMEFDPELFNLSESGVSTPQLAQQSLLKDAIAKGLHARLASQSLVTGQLLIDLSFYPDEPRTLTGADPSTVEIPTTLSDIERLKDILAKLPVEQIATQLLHTIESLDRLVSLPQIPALLSSLTETSNSLNGVAGTLRADLEPLAANANDTLRTARDTLVSAQATLKTADRVTAADLRTALKAATDALQSVEKAMTNANTLMVNSQARADMDQTLRNLTATSRALRGFAEQLERKPNSVIIGR